MTGIDNLQPIDFDFAESKRGIIKPIAYSVKQSNGEILSWVGPSLLDKSHPLATLHNELNGILIKSDFSGEQLLSGKGAGAYPTGSAVFADVLLWQNAYRYHQENSNAAKTGLKKEVLFHFYLRQKKKSIHLPSYIGVESVNFYKGEEFTLANINFKDLKLFFDFAKKHSVLFFHADGKEKNQVQKNEETLAKAG